jgi:hypothetical protein
MYALKFFEDLKTVTWSRRPQKNKRLMVTRKEKESKARGKKKVHTIFFKQVYKTVFAPGPPKNPGIRTFAQLAIPLVKPMKKRGKKTNPNRSGTRVKGVFWII